MKVEVYFNLHKNIFSIRSREKENYGIVIGHSESVVLDAPKFVVRQAGREKVLKEKQKNVHAFVRGRLLDSLPLINLVERIKVTYNPYKFKSFVNKETEEVVNEATCAVLKLNGDDRPIIEAYYYG